MAQEAEAMGQPTAQFSEPNMMEQLNNFLTNINTLLSNPMVSTFVRKYLSKKYGGMPQNQDISLISSPQKPDVLDEQAEAEQTYSRILMGIDYVLTTIGDVPVSQVKDFMAQHKDEVIRGLINAGKLV